MIAKGDVFATYAQFENALEHYCRETNQEFVVAKSEKNELKDDLSLRERPFKLKELKCKHYRKLECKAFIRVNLKKAGIHKMKYLIPSINLQHDNGCPYMTNEGYRCQSDGKDEFKVVLPHDTNESIIFVNELIQENNSKVTAEPKYCGLWASRLPVSTFFIVISWSKAAYY
jgi:hypothetical protein